MRQYVVDGSYLAIGGFEDLSLNDRLATFPSQLRSYLTAAYQGGKVTLLERDAVNTLLREVQLDLAGLTDGAYQLLANLISLGRQRR